MADYESVAAVKLSKRRVLSEEMKMFEIELKLGILHERIVRWNSDQTTMIWDRDPAEGSEFLMVVDEVQQLVQKLTASSASIELLDYADSTLEMAMGRLEEEFVHLLLQFKQPVDSELALFCSTEEGMSEELAHGSFEEDRANQGKSGGDNGGAAADFVVDHIHPDAVFDLSCMAEMMLISKYDKECCQTYIGIRKAVLDECVSVLRIEKGSIEEILKLDWDSLNSLIKRWNRDLQIFIGVYLRSERRLCDAVLGDFSESVRHSCFVEISAGSIMQFLNLGQAIAVGPMKPENLFGILDMYELLSSFSIDIESLFPINSDSFILNEFNEFLSRLGECVRRSFSELKSAIRKNTATSGFSGGGVHPLTSYVMNYIKNLADYSETLNFLLDGRRCEKQHHSQEWSIGSSPTAGNLQEVASILESNLTDISMLYKDNALQSFFIMNNICYMVQKVKNSDLKAILGDDWIKAHSRKFMVHATSYERASWNPVLSFLKVADDFSAAALREKLKSFNAAFEEVYRTQTAWSISNVELREDLKISISLKVLQAYRTFMGRYASHLDGARRRRQYVRYAPEDLEMLLLDLFEGKPKAMHPRKR